MAGTDPFAQAVAVYRQGDVAGAAALCRDLLALSPRHAAALHLLGTIEYATGRPEAALSLLRQAIDVQPDYAEAEFTLGEMLIASGDRHGAVAHFERAADLRPSQPEPFIKLGAVLLQLARLPAAEAAFRRALQLRPLDTAVAADMAAVQLGLGRLDEAVKFGRRAVALAKDFAPAQVQLALALRARYELGALSGMATQAADLSEAEERLRTALRLQPNYAIAVTTLAAILKRQNRLAEAADICRAAVAAAPDLADVHISLAELLVTMGEIDQGLAAIRDARRLRPDDAKAHAALVLYLELADGADDTLVVREARDWQGRFAMPFARRAAPHAKRPLGRPLRIGYVGGSSLRRTPLYNVLAPIVEGHDRQAVEVVCYSDLAPQFEDSFSRAFRARCDWRCTEGLDDDAFAQQVRADAIDVLVDCVQFFPGTRMLALARRPAPIQIAFPLNNTVGGVAIDHVIGDPYIVPPDAERNFAESVLRVPVAHCYRSFEAPPPPVVRPPSLDGGPVTFGSFNWLSKISPGTMIAWARILTHLPQARLLIKCSALQDKLLERRFIERFDALGVEPRRVEIRPWTATYAEHMAAFNEIDLVLDTFPYNGVTTTCDALSMGVPVVTLVGQRPLGRYGLALLRTVGFDDGVTQSLDDYVAAVCRLARDPARLAEWRPALQARFRASPICDGRRIAASLEAVYRDAWVRSGTRA